jgi:hypothetical protein
MSNDNKRITAIFENKTKALRALRSLETMGFSNKDVDMLVTENSWGSDKDMTIEENSKAPEGTAIGATTGAALGALAAGLTSVGAIAATGGLGILATGPIVAAFTGAGAGGTAGGLIGGLVGLGFPEVEAKYVDEELGRGAIMINVNAPGKRYEEVEKSLKDLEAKKVSVH